MIVHALKHTKELPIPLWESSEPQNSTTSLACSFLHTLGLTHTMAVIFQADIGVYAVYNAQTRDSCTYAHVQRVKSLTRETT